MKEIIKWLRSVELSAGQIYQDLARGLAGDQKFSSFLARISEEENWHYHLIGSAAQYLSEKEISLNSALQVDENTRQELKAPFQEITAVLERGKLTRKDVVDFLVKVEFSELNFIFLYVINTLAAASFTFQHVAAVVDAHKKRLIDFLEDLPEDLKVPADIYRLPKIWDKKILIAEDEAPLRQVLAHALKDFGKIESCVDGQEGLERITQGFYNVVISDINMPKVGGIEFYQKAVKINPLLSRQFLFISSTITDDIKALLIKNHLLWLEKPFKLNKLTRTVQELIEKTL